MKQVVLITGGTSGIGMSLAEAYLKQGAAVAVCGRSQAALDRFSDAHPDALAIQADVTIDAARIAMLDAVANRFGRLDVLINNAGTFVERNFATGVNTTQDLEQEVALNLTAPIQLTSEALRRWPTMTAIVFVTSGFALVSPTRAPTYGAVKAGLHAFAEGLRRQLAPRGTHTYAQKPLLPQLHRRAYTPEISASFGCLIFKRLHVRGVERHDRARLPHGRLRSGHIEWREQVGIKCHHIKGIRFVIFVLL
ncbi:MAG: hypothetical protein CMI59_00730 [Parvibaculum sp.]|nr:hypothetical protein [Parvibaculum sp.]